MSHSNGNPNFVSELVQMAKAFEELPHVKDELEAAKHDLSVAKDAIQRLELKLMDRANELDTAHAATRKAEVERDHAETMFLETDSKLDQFMRLAQSFLPAAPVVVATPEPVAVATPTPDTSHYAEVPGTEHVLPAQPGPMGEDATSMPPQEVNETLGQSEVDPIASTDLTSASPNVSTQPVEKQETVSYATEGVSVPVDPIAATDTTDYAAVASEQPATSTTDASSPLEDDVGYHNEPDFQDHAAWDEWCMRMNDIHGINQWPSRYPAAAQ